MTCTKQMAELVECARRRAEPGRNLRAHLAGCSRCAERWESERRLTDEMSTMRRWVATALMAEDTQREVLMRDFASLTQARRDVAARERKNAARAWTFALAIAAAVVVFVAGGYVAARRMVPPAARPVPVHEVWNTQNIYYETNYESSTDASALTGDDFMAVPYTPPLAQGELVRVVHADLYPEALASMGIDVDPAETNEIPADVVVGEDGIPRAVRISENAHNNWF